MNYVQYITSKPIHSLGIKAGDIITLNYTWEDMEEMFQDFSNEFTRILIANSEGELEEIIMDGFVPDIEDLTNEDINRVNE